MNLEVYEGERIALMGPNGAGETTLMLHLDPGSRTDLIGIIKNFAYIPNYLQLAKTEYQGSQLKPGDHVLFLGSGTSRTQKGDLGSSARGAAGGYKSILSHL